MVIILMNTKCEFTSLAFCILIGQKLWEIYMYLRFWKGVKHNVFKNIPQVLLNISRYFKIAFALRFTKHFPLFHILLWHFLPLQLLHHWLLHITVWDLLFKKCISQLYCSSCNIKLHICFSKMINANFIRYLLLRSQHFILKCNKYVTKLFMNCVVHVSMSFLNDRVGKINFEQASDNHLMHLECI